MAYWPRSSQCDLKGRRHLCLTLHVSRNSLPSCFLARSIPGPACDDAVGTTEAPSKPTFCSPKKTLRNSPTFDKCHYTPVINRRNKLCDDQSFSFWLPIRGEVVERNKARVSADSSSHVLTLNQSLSPRVLWGKARLDRPTRKPPAAGENRVKLWKKRQVTNCDSTGGAACSPTVTSSLVVVFRLTRLRSGAAGLLITWTGLLT